MPCSATAAPRMMLPPPITTATCAPRSCTFLISRARYFVYSGEIPNLRSPRRASPESFSSTRRYLAFAGTAICGSLGRLAVGLAELEPLEPFDADVLSRGGGDGRDELADGLRRVADVVLLEQLIVIIRYYCRHSHRHLLLYL